MGGFGSGGAAPGAPGELTLEILRHVWDDVQELQAVIAREGLTVFDAKGNTVPHPALKVLRDSQYAVARIEARLPKLPEGESKLSAFLGRE